MFDTHNHLNALRAFDAVLRLGSIKAAASELCVSDGAVSRHVAQLENAIGAPLFSRNHRSLAPTALALDIGEDVRAGFLRFSTATEKAVKSRTGAQLTIAAPATFLSRWLIPRQASLQRAIGDTPILYLTYHGPTSMAPTEVHLFIGIGPGVQTQAEPFAPFMSQTLCLIINARLYEEVRNRPDWPSHVRRYTPASFPGLWEYWEEQKGELGLKFDGPEITLERMHYAIEAVESGLGYTIAPAQFVKTSMSNRGLISLFGSTADVENYAYHVPKKFQSNAEVERIVRWLNAEAERSRIE